MIFEIIFAEPVKINILCKVQLKGKDIEALKHAIEELYYYEFIIGGYIYISDYNSLILIFIFKKSSNFDFEKKYALSNVNQQ